MWKKILIGLLALVGSFGVGFAYYNLHMNAASSYLSGGNITGRVNIAPANLGGTKDTIGMKKGDRVYLGSHDGKALGWQLITDQIVAGNVVEDSWLAMSNVPIGTVAAYNSYPQYYSYTTYDTKVVSTVTGTASFTESNKKPIMDQFNTQWTTDEMKALIGTRITTYYENIVQTFPLTGSNAFAYTLMKENILTNYSGKQAFLIHIYDLLTQSIPSYGNKPQIYQAALNDLKFNYDYHYLDSYIDSAVKNGTFYFNGTTGDFGYATGNVLTPYAVRPAIYMQKQPIVFAVSTLNSGTLASVSEPQLPSSYTSLFADAVGDSMKVRVLNTNMNITPGKLYNEAETKELPQVNGKYRSGQGYKITLQANGNTAVSGSTVSVLIFNDQGKLTHYAPLGSANGNMSSYQVDLSTLPIGNYQIAVVNEVFDNNVTDPAYSSAISDVIPLEIVESHKITYQKDPQAGATNGDYEYQKNVGAGTAIGKIQVVTAGIPPLTYRISGNGDQSYENFEIEGLDNNNASSASMLKVKIKANAPDLDQGSLKAGTYGFCVETTDFYDAPSTQKEGVTKVCTTLTVAKTTTSITFDDPNQTKKTISDANTSWLEKATATPQAGTKVTYAVVGGDIGLIAIDADTGRITYQGNNAFGKVKIQATVDDDPTTGNDNYTPATAEKEIVIVREVDGEIIPDSASSDMNVPTFQANDANVKTGGTIGKIKGILGTPDTLGGTVTTYAYALKSGGNASFFTINATSGEIKTTANLAVGTYTFTVSVSDRWSSKDILVTVNVGMASAEALKFYENSTSNTVINTKSVKFTDKNISVFATVKGSTNNNPVTYQVKAGEPTNVIDVNASSGVITIKGVGTVVIVAQKQGVSGQADALAELTFTVSAGVQNFIFTTDSTLSIERPKTGNNYDALVESYAPNKTFQLYTTGNPSGSSVTYQLKAGSPSDVISVDPSGQATILNASMNTQIGKVVVQATSHDPTGNYSDQTIELPITIEKGTRTVSFSDQPVYVVSGRGSVTPNINLDGVLDTSGTAVIEIDPSEDNSIAWTNDGVTIQYNWNDSQGKDIRLKVSKPADRNYKVAEGSGVLHILGADENVLTLSTPGKIIYGDHFTIRSTQDDSMSTNVQYTFTTDNGVYISAPQVSGNKAAFDAIKASGQTMIQIKVQRTADGEIPLSKTIQVKVLPKPITITIEDKEKLKGEVNPPLTVMDFTSQLVSWNNVSDIIQPNDIKLSTIAGQSSQAGNYPIRGDQAYLNQTYPNYSFTFNEGTLMIKEENIEDDWYHLEIDDGNNTAYSGNWTNRDVNIVSDHNEYIHLSLDQSTWKTQKLTVNKEGKNEIGFWMKKDSGAITSEKKETIRIDKKAPMVKSIKATDTNNKLQNIINKLSGGVFFKPGTRFDISTSDENGSLEVSGTQSIDYQIYPLDPKTKEPKALLKEGTISVTNEQTSMTIDETKGTYQICMIPKDQAGNEGKEDCHEITLKKINVDEDGDDDPDFNDPDGDGCPDLNIVLGKDSDGFYIKLNVDKDHDGLPELNIDSDGDGIADINVDQDGDGKADLNIVKITKWNPSVCVNDQAEEYCTDPSVIPNINVDLDHDGRPDINIDLDQDGIPDIDIDSDGDGKADVNIDSDHDGTADERIVKLKEWKIDKQIFTYQGVKFQTMTDIKVEEKQQLSDKDITIENKDGSTFSCEMELKVADVTAYEKAAVKNEAAELIEEEREVKIVYEIKLLKNGTEVTPEGTLKIRIPIPEGAKNAALIRRKKEGGYEQIKASIEEGYFVYESEELGIVAIIADKETKESDVKGNYYPGADSGGALTGDTTNPAIYIGMGCVSMGLICWILFKQTKRKVSAE